LREVQAVALRMAEAVRGEAINARGALCYEGKAGQVIDPAMECWPQAEAVVGFLNAWQLSRDHRYLDAAWGIWRFIEEHLADRQGGDWFWRIMPDGSVDPTQPKVSEWKGPYHGTRAGLETIRRLTPQPSPAKQPVAK
jgi:mannobiose 2-epimerase